MFFHIIIAVLASAALIWAAVSDYKTKEIPAPAGFGILALGLFVLLWNKLWIEVIFLILVIWCSSGGIWRLVLIISSLIALFLRGELIIPFVVGCLFVTVMFWSKIIGGGDSQLAVGLVALGHDWAILIYIGLITVLSAFILVIVKKGGVLPGIKRMFTVLRNFSRTPDSEAVQIPWAVIASISGLLYLWSWPFVNGVAN